MKNKSLSGRMAKIKKRSKLFEHWGDYGAGIFEPLPEGKYFGIIKFHFSLVYEGILPNIKLKKDFTRPTACAVHKKDVEFI